MKKIIMIGFTLFALVLISGCDWFQGDDNGGGTTDGETTAGGTTAGATTGTATGDEDGPEEATECGGIASAIEAIEVATISCSGLIPTEHRRTASYYFVIGNITEEEQQAAVEACGYVNKFVTDSGDSNCESKSSGSRLCYNKSVKWMEDLKSQDYSCQRAEAVSYSTVLEQQGYKKVNDKYVKE